MGRAYCQQHGLQAIVGPGATSQLGTPSSLPPSLNCSPDSPLTSDQNAPGMAVPLRGLTRLCWVGPGRAVPHRAWTRQTRFLRGQMGCGGPRRARWQGGPQLLCPRYAHMLTPYMNSVPAVIAKASAIHNPIIYAITHPKYRCGPSPGHGPSPQAHPHGHGGPEAVNGGRGRPSFLSLVYTGPLAAGSSQ